MLPRLIIDKSIIQMLGADLIAELTLWFDLVTTPTLYHEIIGNLREPGTPKTGKRLPKDVLRGIAAKLQHGGTATPASFKSLALGNLMGEAVPMNGFTIPVSAAAANVASREGMLLVDGTAEQSLWARWAAGHYTTADQAVATVWRNGVESLNMNAVGKQWRPFVEENIGIQYDVSGIIRQVEGLLNNPSSETQARLLAILLVFLRVGPFYAAPFSLVKAIDKQAILSGIAPFASSVLKLYLVFISAISLGLIKREPNSYVDLQYLFYTPFASGFASNDKLHRRLLPAAGGTAIFVEGITLRDDLAQRQAWRKSLPDEAWGEHRAEYGIYPREVPGSIISDLWMRSAGPRRPRERSEPKMTLDELNQDPRMRKMMDDARSLTDDVERRESAGDALWPIGDSPDDTLQI